jgi:5-hydroxyisourate hydrolase
VTEVTTHVLDTAAGRPAAGVPVSLHVREQDGGWEQLGSATTNTDGRAQALAGEGAVNAGVYRLVFDTAAYLEAPAFFDEVIVTFRVADEHHLHIPLLLSPYGYSVYRGS